VVIDWAGGRALPNSFDLFAIADRSILRDQSDPFGERCGSDQAVASVTGICGGKLIGQDGNSWRNVEH
jgi:hypothetical protein